MGSILPKSSTILHAVLFVRCFAVDRVSDGQSPTVHREGRGAFSYTDAPWIASGNRMPRIRE